MKLKFKKFVPIILLIGTTLSLIGSMTPTSAAGIHHPENAPNCIGVCSGTELEAYPNLLKALEVPTSENPGDWLWYKLPDGPVWSDGQSWGNPEYYSTIQAGDINGDGRAELLARGAYGILAYEFDSNTNAWVQLPDGPAWSDAAGWNQPQYYSTIQMGDIDGDGRAELLARGADGILVYEFDSNTNAWSQLPNGPAWSDDQSWNQPQYYSTIQTGDINGDGRAELLARSADEILVYEFDSNTNAWSQLPNGPAWSNIGGWDAPQYYSTIQTGDIDGDGRVELLARGAGGILAYGFDPGTNAWVQLPDGPAWSDGQSWDLPKYYSTIQTGDINGDGRAELLGRSADGILVYGFNPNTNAWGQLPGGPAWNDVVHWDYPEYYDTIQTSDIDGNGRAELLARGAGGIEVYGFDPNTNAWSQLPNGPTWSDAEGWNTPQYYSTIQTGDLDGDGRAELLARADVGISAYGLDPFPWNKLPFGPIWSDAESWNQVQYYSTIQTGDINGDGRAELLGRSADGILVYGFDPDTTTWVQLPGGPAWSNLGGWDDPKYYSTIQTGDIDGDGRAELLARGAGGILAYDFDPNTNAWSQLPAGPVWSDAESWNQIQYYSTIQLGDINGDGRDELLGRSADGILVYGFDPGTNAWVQLPGGPAWSDVGGWDDPKYYSTIQTGDIDGDGRAELLARGAGGIEVYGFDSGTNTWEQMPNGPAWSDAQLWNTPEYYSTIQTGDINGDGRAELLARSADEIVVYGFDPGTNAWSQLPNGPTWGNIAGWNTPEYYGTIQTGDINGDGRAELLARGASGILAYGFDPATTTWEQLPNGPTWSNTAGWNAPQYYSTIQTGDLDGDGQNELLGRAGIGIEAWDFNDAIGTYIFLPLVIR